MVWAHIVPCSRRYVLTSVRARIARAARDPVRPGRARIPLAVERWTDQKPAVIRVKSQSFCAMPLQFDTTPPPGQPRSRLTAQ
ncbi:hypothetical protein GCM10027161_48030 [Microbispora hainanensis]